MNPTSSEKIVSCPGCGAKNRASSEKLAEKKAICGRCKTSLTAAAAAAADASPSQPLIVTDRNFAGEIENSPLPVLLDLWAPWCGPCRMIAPTVEQLAKELAGRVRVGKLNVDENPATAARFNVQGIPTLLILKGGREVDRIVGVQSKEVISGRLQRFL